MKDAQSILHTLKDFEETLVQVRKTTRTFIHLPKSKFFSLGCVWIESMGGEGSFLLFKLRTM